MLHNIPNENHLNHVQQYQILYQINESMDGDLHRYKQRKEKEMQKKILTAQDVSPKVLFDSAKYSIVINMIIALSHALIDTEIIIRNATNAENNVVLMQYL